MRRKRFCLNLIGSLLVFIAVMANLLSEYRLFWMGPEVRAVADD
jgi:hypothetical protein